MPRKQTLRQRLLSKWQDKIISGGQTVMGLVMIPALLDSSTTIPLTTSIPIAVCLSAFSVVFYSMKMKYAAYTSLASAVLWEGLVILRHG